jgi:hypothetical protein
VSTRSDGHEFFWPDNIGFGETRMTQTPENRNLHYKYIEVDTKNVTRSRKYFPRRKAILSTMRLWTQPTNADRATKRKTNNFIWP